ncbi:Gfo/Idh/MocA family protein [Microbacterium sp. YJN-G]|uniref:Gfo/Idh/MocA family protein n=1 Tax=Microbacterium sp. YJN-G TaxID=2763257 RepID=UPI00187821C2|nr:Gfo/Idh/MocA family oxidoreductase [Microbacterium sp. YJN-G]
MTYRIAVVGAGDWASRHHLPALASDPRAEIAVIVDADPARRADAGERFDAPVAESLQPHLDRGGLDAVVIATPHTTHAPLLTAVLDAGVAALVEKPLTLNSAEATALVARAGLASVPVLVGYTAQYTPAALAARSWVQEELGELRQVIVEFSSRAGARYAQADAGDTRSAYSAASGAGQATTQLTHAFAAICYTTGRAFTEIAALTADAGGAVDVDDAVAFRLDGGVTGAAASTGALPAGLPMRHVVRYIGEYGIVEHDLLLSTARLDGQGGVSRRVAPTHAERPYPADAPVRALLDVLDGAAMNPAPIWPAAAAVAGIESVLRSARSGRREAVAVIPR